MKNFSIIICTINRANLLDKGLWTLTHQDYLKKDYEIIVIDDGSKDNTREIVLKHKKTFPNIKYVYVLKDTEYTSPARARNIGFEESTYKYCCFTDPEILVPTNMLKMHNVIHEINEKCIVCTRPILMTKEETIKIDDIDFKDLNLSKLNDLIPSLLNENIHTLEMNQKQWKDNHFSSFKREDFLKINGVNEKFDKWGFEGIDFVERMISLGLELINVDKVYHMWHDAPRDMKIANKQRLEHGVKDCGKS